MGWLSLMKVTPIILAGGFGTRLAPLSTENRPKQFLPLLVGGYSFFQQTIRRLRVYFRQETLTIVINVKHQRLAIEQLAMIDEFNVKLIIEPENHNTFAPILLGLLTNKNADLLFATPTDLHIDNYKAFASDLHFACHNAYLYGKQTIFGIKPTYASSEYGYIKISKISRKRINDVLTFTEKPSMELAEKFLADGNYLWNSGMFLFNTKLLKKEVKKYQPQSFEGAQKVVFMREKTQSGIEILYPSDKEFLQITKTSIDYAISEKSKHMCCISANFDWMDAGSWRSIAILQRRDQIQIDEKMAIKLNTFLSHSSVQACWQ